MAALTAGNDASAKNVFITAILERVLCNRTLLYDHFCSYAHYILSRKVPAIFITSVSMYRYFISSYVVVKSSETTINNTPAGSRNCQIIVNSATVT